MRIGEIVWLRWPNINLVARRVHLVEFATRLGWDLIESSGKSSAAVRPIDLDDYLIAVLRQQKGPQKYEASRPGYHDGARRLVGIGSFGNEDAAMRIET
jgi:hypothetical protein